MPPWYLNHYSPCVNLTYPLGENVKYVEQIEWMTSKLRDKCMYWKSQLDHFMLNLKLCNVLQNPWYYILVIATMYEEGFALCFATAPVFCCRERGTAWVVQNRLAISKLLEWATIPNYLCIWWLAYFHCCKTCFHNHKHGYLLSNISLSRRL